MIGKKIRIERIFNRKSGNTVIVPMDHGVTVGPVEGLTDMKSTIDRVVTGGANAILMHKGMVAHGHREGGEDVGLIVHMSASTSLSIRPNQKVLSCQVEEAIKTGADAVSIHVNLGAENEADMLKKFGKVGERCQEWGMPLLVMMYTRGPQIDDEYDSEVVAHAARAGAELGADIVKCNYTGDPDRFSRVVDGCPVPVVIAGGEKMDSDSDALHMVDSAMKAGARGVSIGRNVFQARRPEKMVKAISEIVHSGNTAAEAGEILDE